MPIPIIIGLIVLAYSCLAKVKFESAGGLIRDTQVLSLTLVQNWIFGPLFMFLLAATFLRNSPHLMAGVMLLGLARSTCAVIAWNEMAGGDREFCSGLAAINALFQIIAYSSYAWLFLNFLPLCFGLPAIDIHIPLKLISGVQIVYLGIPLLAAVLSRHFLIERKGSRWYEAKFVPALDHLRVAALTFTALWMLTTYDHHIARSPAIALHVAGVLIFYHVGMFLLSFYQAARAGAEYDKTFTFAFSSAANNFPLAIATATLAFGINSDVTFACAIGALVEFALMLALVPGARALSCKIVELLPAVTPK